MTILDDRGLFWWADEPVPEEQFAPDASIAGRLTIDHNGQARLELDGYFPSAHGAMTPIARNGQYIDKDIQGLLAASKKRVLLKGITGNGGALRSNNISYERYIAEHCLVFDEMDKTPSECLFSQIIIPLTGFEAWLGLSNIVVQSSDSGVNIEYKKQNDLIYEVEDGTISFLFEINDIMSGSYADVCLKQKASAVITLENSININEIIYYYKLFEDLMLVLTGSLYPLEWPWIGTPEFPWRRLYFLASGRASGSLPPQSYECLTSFVELREQFGEIWTKWKQKREAFGPGFFLYLGTRRAVGLYVENRFINLIFGLEALHRKKHSSLENNPEKKESNLDNKINRIPEGVLRPKDKKGLAGQLKSAKEPRLNQRLFEILRGDPLNLDDKLVENFCVMCGKLRNAISHVGGQRDKEESYREFCRKLEINARALAVLYQAVMLHEIGVSASIIVKWAFQSHSSFINKHYLTEAGLLISDK